MSRANIVKKAIFVTGLDESTDGFSTLAYTIVGAAYIDTLDERVAFDLQSAIADPEMTEIIVGVYDRFDEDIDVTRARVEERENFARCWLDEAGFEIERVSVGAMSRRLRARRRRQEAKRARGRC